MNPNIYDALCKALSDRAGQVDWAAFTAADWDRFAQRAVAEGVGPLIHWTLKGSDKPSFTPAALPPSAVQTLAEAYYQSAAHNALLFKELERILEALGEAGIPVIVLKGAALAHTLYPDPALRPMNDLDLLVKPEDLWKALKKLRALGFHQEKVTYHVVMRGGAGQAITVEVHWCLMPGVPPGKPDPDWFWAQTEPFMGSGLSLRPTAQLLYLASHLMIKEVRSRTRLLWLYGLDQLARAHYTEIDWQTLPEQAGRMGWGTGCVAALKSVGDRLGTPVSAGVLVGLAAVGNEAGDPPGARDWARDALQELGWPARLRVLWGLAVPSPAYLKWRYAPEPSWLWPVGYLMRWRYVLRQAISIEAN